MVGNRNPPPISEISSKELTIGLVLANLFLGSMTDYFSLIAIDQYQMAGVGPMFFVLLSLAAPFGIALARIWVKYIKEVRRRYRM